MASRRAAVANGRAVVSSVRLDKKAVMMLINGFVSVANLVLETASHASKKFESSALCIHVYTGNGCVTLCGCVSSRGPVLYRGAMPAAMAPVFVIYNSHFA